MTTVPILTKKLSTVSRQRNLSIAACAVFAFVAIMACMVALAKKDRIITIPTTIDSYIVEKGRVSENMLYAFTRDWSNLFLNRSPYDSDYFEENVFRIVHPSKHRSIRDVLSVDEENNKFRAGTRNWLPENMCVIRKENRSEVEGKVQIYVNGQQVLSRTVRQYFEWEMEGTRIWLVDSGEIAEGGARCLGT